MKRALITVLLPFIAALVIPLNVHAQAATTTKQKPPIAQQLVREGDLAIKLIDAFKLGPAADETEAETKLGNAGIAPRNGWIADYPVTPDIIGELNKSVGDAADAQKLKMSKEEAQKAFQTAAATADLAVRSGASEQSSKSAPTYDDSADNTTLNNYYSDQGPPVVTYYAPPPDYVYLYTWVPYPFWWWNFWFPGYFILGDFHRVIHVHHRVEIISNHFVDHRANRVFRIDPIRRFSGRTFGGIGVPRSSRPFIITGTRGGNATIFRGSRERSIMGNEKTFTPSGGAGRESGSRSDGRTFSPSQGGGHGHEGGQHTGGGRLERR